LTNNVSVVIHEEMNIEIIKEIFV